MSRRMRFILLQLKDIFQTLTFDLSSDLNTQLISFALGDDP